MVGFAACQYIFCPWALVGFGRLYCVLGSHEKRGGVLPKQASCSEFQEMMTNCDLIQLPTKGMPFTWTNKRGIGARVEMRLDRCLPNLAWMDAWPILDCSTLPRISSDHCPLLVSFSMILNVPKAPFRFQRMWLDHPGFISVVDDVWKSSQFFGCPMFVLACKLHLLKHKLRAWNKNEFGDVNANVESAIADLEEVQLEISNLGPSEDRILLEDDATVRVNAALESQEKFYCDKSRISWLSNGDRNTSFFHAMVKVRNLKQSLSVMRDGNRLLEDPKEVSGHIIDYFRSLFTADYSVVDTGLVDRTIPCLVSDLENNALIAMPSSDEIYQVMCSMDHSSAPGPDGFGGVFYSHCWSIVGQDVVSAVQSFFSQSYILPNFNSNLMVLIPKVQGADSVTQLRHIALANFVFKIITKVLADRLSPIASRIIYPLQSAFIKGRSIADPIITTSECINLLDRSCQGGNIAIKFDICKAFDTLD
ncbi:uncharacterized protein LOC112170746 [Rosa chinensis]|uniref:uncharacterized protein LOC112170746 n=1 Tax=Rosa chinensis TaxID=74649 RepID=UPI000D0911E7|nr:uncharacterized protein LOC112170746 [Rosa chinensis]